MNWVGMSYCNNRAKRSQIAIWAAALAAAVALNGVAMGAYDFSKAWRVVDEARGKDLPRTVTNKVAEIEREAVAVGRWPDAARAFLLREQAMKRFTDEQTADWLPALAASVDAQPAPLQAVLQLHLAHTYLDNSQRWRWGGDSPTKLDDDAAKDKMPPWSPEKIGATIEEQFEKVFARSDELKAQKMSRWELIFGKGGVPESYCPTLFDFAVRDAVKFYGEDIPDKTLEKGLALYDRLIAFHAADGNRDALALAEFDRAEYVREFDEKPEKERTAAFSAFLDDFIGRHEGKTDVVAIAAAKKAEMLNIDGKRVAAHELAATYAAKWPGSIGGRRCANLVPKIEEPELSFKTERNWCAPWPEIKVSARNLSEVHFRLVPVSFDDLVDDRSIGTATGGYNASDALKFKYIKRKPAKVWKESFPLKPTYCEQDFVFASPSDVKPGHYVLYAAANDKFGSDKLPLFAQYVTVTPLALVLKTGNGEFKGTVYRAESGEPVEGAKIELWGYPDRGGRFSKLRERYSTDADGRFAADVKKGENGVLMRHVRVVKDGSEVLSLGNDGSGRPDHEDPEYEHVDLFTDRALYRPGQEILVKGIAYHANPNTRDFRTLPGETILVTLTDPNGKEVGVERMKATKWGSFKCVFAVPVGRLTGQYKVMARVVLADGKSGERTKVVNVEEYKRPKFTAEFGEASDNATLGAAMTVEGRALTYSGLPVQKAKVEWEVERSTRYPDWCRWFGIKIDDDGENFVAEGTAETDENGVFKVTFIPVASPKADLSGDPSFNFTVTATVTDGTGEARTAQTSFEVGTVALRADIWKDGDWLTADKPVKVNVSLRSLAGTHVPVRGTLRAFRLKAPARPVRKPAGEGRYSSDRDAKGPWDWETWEPGEEILSIDAEQDGRAVSTKPPEKWTTELKLGVGAYRLVFEAKDQNGKTVKGIDSFCVFDPHANGLGIAMPELFRVEAHNVKVGGTMRVYWGTGYERGWCRVKVTSNGKAILDKYVSGDSPLWLCELPVADEHRGKLEVETTFVRENRIYHNSATVWVPWDNKHLNIKAEHLTEKLNPGKVETWKFKVSGSAEVLAFMYDRSLDAYKWHDVTLGLTDHFTPWTGYSRSPVLQNVVENLPVIDGKFTYGSCYSANLVFPSWRSLGGYGFGLRRGFAAGEAKCAAGAAMVEEAACGEAPVCAAKSPAMPNAANAEPDSPPRTNLKETAFFFPDLETDAEGNVSFTFTAPDALTGWKLLMVAHDNELRGGILRNDDITTTKPLMCEPNPPRFVREGDDFLFAVKVTNTEEEPQSGVVELSVGELGRETIGEGREIGEGLAASRVSRLVSPAPQPFSLAPHESKTFEFHLAIPDGCGYLKYVAKAKGESFADGEEGVLPVLSRRVLVREAVQLNARGAKTKAFKLENLLASKGSGTIRHQDLTVRAVSRPAWYAVLSMPYLMEFPHECCEQTFSRYYANALGEFIANSDPRIRETFDAWKAAGAQALKSPLESDPHLKSIAIESTPWVREAEHETAARARLGDLFDGKRLAGEQAKCMEKLMLLLNDDRLWPWFPGGPSSPGITLYILTGFARLNHLAGLGCPSLFADAVAALDREVAEDVKDRRNNEKKLKIPFRVNGFDIRWLYLHSFKGVPKESNAKDSELFVKHVKNEWTDFGLESQALAAIALKRRGDERAANEIMASIKERGVVSDELGMYWKRPYFFSCSVFAAPVSTQALVVEAFREVTGDEESAEACNVWLLKQKQTQDWTTTAATADAIYALMLGGGADLLAGTSLAEVSLGGEKVVPENAEKGTGMWSVRYAADAIRPEMGEISFTGAGAKGVSWGGVHWSYFEDVLKVRAHEPKELRIEKKYYKKVSGPKGARLTSIDGVLDPGDELVARLEITSDRTYEFVHLRDERPACAEPVDVLSSYRWRDGVGYYQSTRDTATHYYIDRLNKGVFVLETSYRVQQRGRFSGGLATIQCMYAPEFTAHSSAEQVGVGARGAKEATAIK